MAATPIRAPRDRGRADRQGRGRRRRSAAAAEILGAEGTPIDDHRASAPVPRGDAPVRACSSCTRRTRRSESSGSRHDRSRPHRRKRSMSDLATRPQSPAVGHRDPARERGAARHRRGALHRRPGLSHQGRAARLSGAGPVRARADHRAEHRAGARRARRGARADRRRRARRQRRRGQARRAAVPDRRSCSSATPCAGCWARRSRPRGSAPTAVEVEARAAAVLYHGQRGDRGPRASRARSRRWRAATSTAGLAEADRTCSAASSSSPARSTSTSRRTARWRTSTRAGRSSSRRSTQHPSETQEIVAHVLGLPQPRGHRAVPADGRRRSAARRCSPTASRRSRRSARSSPAVRCGCGSTAPRT